MIMMYINPNKMIQKLFIIENTLNPLTEHKIFLKTQQK